MSEPPLKLCLFHLMPWPFLECPPGDWPVAHRLFEPPRGARLYREYLDQMTLAGGRQAE